MHSLVDRPTPWLSDDSMIVAMRFILASAALLIIYLDPAEPDRYVATTYTTLALYVVYSAALYILALRHSLLLQSLRTVAHWVDVGWYTLLIALSSGTNSIFFFGFYFAILVASFRWGFTSGVWVTLVSTVLFTVVGFKTAPAEPVFELNRFLLRPTGLLGLGYMMAYWGGFEIGLQRRLALLNEVSTLANPRFSVDRTLTTIMQRLQVFYDVDTCLLVESDQVRAVHNLRRVDRYSPEAVLHATPIPAGLARLLGALQPQQAVVHCRRPRLWRWESPWPRDYVYDVGKRERATSLPEANGALATILDDESFATVPLRVQGETVSRLYLLARRWCAFRMADVDFLLQVGKHIMPILDNIRLVDRLAAGAAEEERHRIARDLHDSVIQPYIGLQLGLAAVYQKLTAGNTDIRGDLERLIEVAGVGVTDLRRYVSDLRDGRGHEGDLLSAVRRFTTKFAEATGIAVHVEAETAMRVSGRLASEVFQMIAEGLSNVRRHTDAGQATIGLASRDNQLILRIENENMEEWAPFTPRSITERAAALGGNAHVERQEDNRTVVVAEIPL